MQVKAPLVGFIPLIYNLKASLNSSNAYNSINNKLPEPTMLGPLEQNLSMAIITGGGAIFSAAAGNLNILIAAPFAIAALGGLLLGLLLGKKLSGPHTQLIFSIFTLVIAISLLAKGVMLIKT